MSALSARFHQSVSVWFPIPVIEPTPLARLADAFIIGWSAFIALSALPT